MVLKHCLLKKINFNNFAWYSQSGLNIKKKKKSGEMQEFGNADLFNFFLTFNETIIRKFKSD